MIPVFQPIVSKSDIKSVVSALKKGEISGSFGKNIKLFEKNFANFIKTKYSVAVSSGTTALHLAVAVCKFSRGSEIIISATTNIATALAVVHNSCIPVPIDSDSLTWNLNIKKIEERITKKTKAIIVVHFLGNPVDMWAIQRIAKKHNLVLIEDAAEAHGAEYKGKKVGSFGHFGCFSLYANKVITSGEGGIITTNSNFFFEKLKLYRHLGFAKPRFKHYISGYNFRMTGYQAAFANSQLKYINSIIKKKIFIQKSYEKYLSGIRFIKFQKTIDKCKNIYWMVGILISSKSRVSKKILIEKLKSKGIETRSFFMSMREQPCLKNFFTKNKKTLTPVSNLLWKNGLYLPSSHNLSKKKIKYICNIIKKIFS
jgi:perosamine synthetase